MKQSIDQTSKQQTSKQASKQAKKQSIGKKCCQIITRVASTKAKVLCSSHVSAISRTRMLLCHILGRLEEACAMVVPLFWLAS
jgi:hypothetical protein